MTTNTISTSSKKSPKYLLQPTKKPFFEQNEQNELSEISEEEKSPVRFKNQADILKEIIIEKNK
jgi:hypothetical protein